ncbi:MAG: thioredoxin [Longimicrobiales bacterium]
MTTTGTDEAKRATLRCQFCLTLNRVDVRRAGERPRCGACGRPFLLDRPIKVSDEDFDRTVRGADVPVLVDFYADWCGPCKMLAPMLDDLAGENAGRILVAKVDTDAAPKISSELGIRSVPTVILFENGTEMERSLGIEPERLKRMVDEAA